MLTPTITHIFVKLLDYCSIGDFGFQSLMGDYLRREDLSTTAPFGTACHTGNTDAVDIENINQYALYYNQTLETKCPISMVNVT